MLMGERILKFVIFVLGVLAVLGSLGFNMSTALAGLGIAMASTVMCGAEVEAGLLVPILRLVSPMTEGPAASAAG